ncbi:Orf80 [Heliothis zea nudivirus]|uniref:Orf80 n=1 Tax=Heliothis zea nudivirus 1 TaxID=3116536 RepID=Q8JKN3_9VIRU|nr:Orf80 [Heliothis zea nudivirus]AAN04374.1 Orf80 [Heliothis zea nudivirus]
MALVYYKSHLYHVIAAARTVVNCKSRLSRVCINANVTRVCSTIFSCLINEISY